MRVVGISTIVFVLFFVELDGKKKRQLSRLRKNGYLIKKKHHSIGYGKIKKIMNKAPNIKYPEETDSFQSSVNNGDINRAEIERRTPQLENMMDPKDSTTFNSYANDNPILWSDPGSIDSKLTHVTNPDKRGGDEEEPPDEASPPMEMPNTALPNPNIYGGFPENDIWGNFELPAPNTIDHLKLALKMNHHRPNYGGDQASDMNDQLYGYEHHALPEYDNMETPPFQEVMWQNAQLQQALKGGKKPGCAPGMGSCPPVNNPVLCQNLHQACAANAQHPKDPKVNYENPCADKILALFGCGEKPEMKPPKPKPPKPKPKPKPKPIPIKEKKPPPKKEDKEKEKDDKPGEQLTSEDAGSKLTEESLKQILDGEKSNSENAKNSGESTTETVKAPTEADAAANAKPTEVSSAEAIQHTESSQNTNHEQSEHTPKLEEADAANAVTQGQARQSFDKGANASPELGKVGLMNEEQSLALMTAIGNDLQKSLAEKFRGDTDDEKISDDDQRSTAELHDDTKIKQVDKQMTSSFVTNTNKLKSEETIQGGGERVFSDWSSWSKCSKTCGRGKISRHRNCLKEMCSGGLVERKVCINNGCHKHAEQSIKQVKAPTVNGLSIPDKELFETIQPVDNDVMKLEDGHSSDSASLGNTFQNVVTHFTNEILNDTRENDRGPDDEKSDANVIANLLEEKLNKNNFSSGTEKAPAGETSDATAEPKKQAAPVTWGAWSECSSKCGIGHTSRTLQCEHDQCDENLVEKKPCRRPVCSDPLAEHLLEKDCMSLQNEFRRRHGAEPLEWSNDLYRKAIEISDRVALKNVPAENITKYERPGLNLGYVQLNFVNNKTDTTPCMRAVEEWYGQKTNYNYNKPQLTTADRDFTQLVWKATKRVGISKTFSMDGTVAYIAAVYQPIGNVDSYYDMKKNALPAKSEDEEKTMEDLDKLIINKKKSVVATRSLS